MTVKGFNRTWSEENEKWFKKNIFSYDSNMDKIQGYVYSLVEAICFQCGFFSWEELRK